MITEKEVRDCLDFMGIEISQCKDCKDEIIWLKTKKQKWHPVNIDLTSHFSTCPAADKFRKKTIAIEDLI